MAISSEFLSTRQVASLFRVTETTVKRWADDAILPCEKSPGGHRKFRMSDLIVFAERQGYPIAGSLEPPLTVTQMEQVRSAVHNRNYYAIAQVLFDVALQADTEAVFQLMRYLSRHNVKLSTLADEVLRPPLVKIGELWKAGKLRIDQEHRSSRAVTEAMVRLAPELHRKKANALTVACACLQGERHEIGLRGMAFALEAEGWDVHFIGADTPYAAVVEYVRVAKPDLLCVSFTSAKPDSALARGFASVGKAVRLGGGKFVAGGYFAENFTTKDLSCDHIAGSVTDGIDWIRETFALRPGPRLKSRHSGVTR